MREPLRIGITQDRKPLIPPGRVALLTLAALATMAGALSAQNPFGTEFRINTYTTGTQRFASVGGAGQSYLFVVTWESAGQDGSQDGVFGQRYAGFDVAPVGAEFQVNTYSTANQFFADVAMDPTGNFIVVWQSDGQDGDGPGVFGQRFAGWGPAFGGEFRVNSFTTQAQGFPDVAASSAGFVVVWESAGQDGSDYGIFGQRYDAGGAPLGPEFRVNTYTTGAQRAPAVAYDPGGNFMVTWEGESADDQLLGVRGQRYSSTGAPLGGEFRVNTYTPGNQRSAALAADEFNEGFTVVWQSEGQDGSGDGVFGQRYSPMGFPLGSEFQVNTYTTGRQSYPAVGEEYTGNGCFLVVWSSDGEDGSGSGIFGRVYVFGTQPQGVFPFNQFTTGNQTRVAVGALPKFDLLAIWDSEGQDGSGIGVYANVDVHFIPVELMDFTVQ